jgi:ubiquitin-protein ligase
LSLEQDGLLIRFNPDNIQEAFMCLVGPDCTPYEHCFFLFKFTLAHNHPDAPPSAAYLTNNGICRFNPNLYVDGKVCLSILGTWQGPGWQPSTLECVGHTLRSTVLTDTPLRCEPGYECSHLAAIASYSRFVEFHSLDFALSQAIQFPPSGCSEFHDDLIEYFIHHMDFYMAKLSWLSSHHEGEQIGFDFCYDECRPGVANYSSISQKLKDLYKSFTGTDWVQSSDGGFDPTKRVWYPECDPALAALRAPTGYDDLGGYSDEWVDTTDW